MSAERAAQFAPFAALTGHDAAVAEAGRQTEKRIELAQDSRDAINRMLQQLKEMPTQPQITLTYFRPDERKEGGAYLTVRTRLRQMDPVQHILTLDTGEEIPMENLVDLRF